MQALRLQAGATIILLALAPLAADARQPRSQAAIGEFKRQHPCPATNLPRGSCPGWIIDHIIPLCAGGADNPGNMQWQSSPDAKAKDREERQQCKQNK